MNARARAARFSGYIYDMRDGKISPSLLLQFVFPRTPLDERLLLHTHAATPFVLDN